MTNIIRRRCLECGEWFERDMDEPKFRKAYEQMGALADQCDRCLRKMLKGD